MADQMASASGFLWPTTYVGLEARSMGSERAGAAVIMRAGEVDVLGAPGEAGNRPAEKGAGKDWAVGVGRDRWARRSCRMAYRPRRAQRSRPTFGFSGHCMACSGSGLGGRAVGSAQTPAGRRIYPGRIAAAGRDGLEDTVDQPARAVETNFWIVSE